jgi:hypothetical protein
MHISRFVRCSSMLLTPPLERVCLALALTSTVQ